VLEEKASGSEPETDEDVNIFEKLLGQTREPDRRQLIRDYNPKDKDLDDSNYEYTDDDGDTEESDSSGVDSDSERTSGTPTDEEPESDEDVEDGEEDDEADGDTTPAIIKDVDSKLQKEIISSQPQNKEAG
jgi:hypothetical protein